MKKYIRISIGLTFLLSVGVLKVYSAEQTGDEFAFYYFHEHLAEAKALVTKLEEGDKSYEKPRLQKYYGKPEKELIVFPDLPTEPAILFETLTYEGAEQDGIFMAPHYGGVKSLQFSDVPPASKMIVHYGISDSGLAEVQRGHVYLSIWIGNHPLKRIILPMESGWQTQSFDLGVVGFFLKPLTVTFELTSDNPKMTHFSFFAELYE